MSTDTPMQLGMIGTAMQAITVRDRATGVGALSLTEMPYPRAAQNDVIVRVHAAGFTRGELDWPGRPVPAGPLPGSRGEPAGQGDADRRGRAVRHQLQPERTEISPAQAAILGHLGIDPPPRIYQLTPAATG
jgi:hypothetical protein